MSIFSIFALFIGLMALLWLVVWLALAIYPVIQMLKGYQTNEQNRLTQNMIEKDEAPKGTSSILWFRLSLWLIGGFIIGIVGITFLTIFAVAPAVDCILEKCSFKDFLKKSDGFDELLLFSLGLIGASATFTISLWRGKQIYEQISKAEDQLQEAQEQSKLTRFQNAIEMATQKDNAGRCVAGLRILANIYKNIEAKPEKTADDELDKQSIHSAALYVLSIDKKDKAKKVSSTARQWALDILVRGEFLSYHAHKNNTADPDGMGMPILDSTIEKDFSYLDFTRALENQSKTLNLSKFSFRDCDFSGANLSDINFSGADFTGAKLYGANLSRTNLSDIRGLPFKNLFWSYFYEDSNKSDIEQHPKIRVRGWRQWVAHVVTRQEAQKFNLTGEIFDTLSLSSSISIERQDFMANFTLALDKIQYTELYIQFKSNCAPTDWFDFIREHLSTSSYNMRKGFGEELAPEVWDYLKYVTEYLFEKGAISHRFSPDRETAEITIRHPRVSLWEKWKENIREIDSNPEYIEDGAWGYMKQLAEEDSNHPPREVETDDDEQEIPF